MNKYEKLLDSIYDNLPSGSKKAERFEFPEFDSFIEGNKTIIKNFESVATKLRRDKNMLVKFLSKELATPASLRTERLIIQRKVNPSILKSKLDEFIRDYVMCQVCNKPDTKISSVGNLKEIVCEACGARRPVK